MEVQGAYHYCEHDDSFWVRVIYRCPFCTKHHVQEVKGSGTAKTGVDIQCKCGLGECRIVPYRKLK
jgi:hypothetical protein